MDPYLNALMRGEQPYKKKPSTEEQAPKSKLEIEQAKEIDSFVNAFNFEEDHNQSLIDPKHKREKLKIAIKESMKMPELSKHIDRAVGILFKEGSRYLSSEVNQNLIVDLAQASDQLENIGLEEATSQNLQTLSKMSDESINGIQEIALAKFKEERYADSVSLFSLLSILNPGFSEYWFRLGIAAQKDNDLDLASRAYASAQLLDPTHIGAKLFAAECFVLRGLLDQAKADLAAAEAMSKETEIDKMWLDLISAIQGMLKEKQA
ncbi:MAG: hypothetical protein H0V82_05725 [Candidatus Protochlamydia sp.]|nr:hypothetical protein [Candidatus Protochlamydia sp.]